MKLSLSKKANINYLAKIVDIKDFNPHRNPEVTRMKVAKVGGYEIIVGLDEKPGIYIYFPTSSVINPELLAFANLYRHSEKNSNPEKAGFFEDNGRVKAIKLKGQVSEGFLLPFNVFSSFIQSNLNIDIYPEDVEIGQEFDQFEHNEKIVWINKKFKVQRTQGTPGSGNKKEHRNNKKEFNRIIDTQFRFHYDTVLVKKEPWCILPSDIISITDKWHGTSGISAKVLVKKSPNLFQRIFNINPGVEYGDIFASRTKIRSEGKIEGDKYDQGVYAYADEIIRPHLIKGMTAYYEICGYYPNGAAIQKQGDDYDYGCVPPEKGTYIYGKNFKIMVYRITLTNVDGIVHEFSAKEVQTWCSNEGLTPVIERYYGFAKDLYDIKSEDIFEWEEAFWDHLANDKNFYMELNSPDCVNKVAHEGVVIKKEDMRSRAWKLKTFAFLNKEQADLDAGIENAEDNA